GVKVVGNGSWLPATSTPLGSIWLPAFPQIACTPFHPAGATLSASWAHQLQTRSTTPAAAPPRAGGPAGGWAWAAVPRVRARTIPTTMLRKILDMPHSPPRRELRGRDGRGVHPTTKVRQEGEDGAARAGGGPGFLALRAGGEGRGVLDRLE